MVFCGGCLEINPDEARCISSSCTKHQGGRCSLCKAMAWLGGEDYQMVSKLSLAEEEMNTLFNDDR